MLQLIVSRTVPKKLLSTTEQVELFNKLLSPLQKLCLLHENIVIVRGGGLVYKVCATLNLMPRTHMKSQE